MRKFLALGLVSLGLLFAGCSNPNKEVVGTWKPDTKSIQIHLKDKEKDQLVQTMLKDPEKRKEALNEFTKMSMVLNADGTGSFSGPDGKSETGSYRVVGNKIEDGWNAKKGPDDPDKEDITISPDHKTIHMHLEGKTSGMDMIMDLDFNKAS